MIACLNCLNHSATRSCPPRLRPTKKELRRACACIALLATHVASSLRCVRRTAANPLFRAVAARGRVRSFVRSPLRNREFFLPSDAFALLSLPSPLLSFSLSLLHFSLNNLILAQSSRPLINSLRRRRRDDKPSELMKACSDRSLALARSAKSGP